MQTDLPQNPRGSVEELQAVNNGIREENIAPFHSSNETTAGGVGAAYEINFFELPELIERIISFSLTSPRSIFNMAMVSKKHNRIVYSPMVWDRLGLHVDKNQARLTSVFYLREFLAGHRLKLVSLELKELSNLQEKACNERKSYEKKKALDAQIKQISVFLINNEDAQKTGLSMLRHSARKLVTPEFVRILTESGILSSVFTILGREDKKALHESCLEFLKRWSNENPIPIDAIFQCTNSIPALIQRLSLDNAALTQTTLLIMRKICTSTEHCTALVKTEGFVPRLVTVLENYFLAPDVIELIVALFRKLRSHDCCAFIIALPSIARMFAEGMTPLQHVARVLKYFFCKKPLVVENLDVIYKLDLIPQLVYLLSYSNEEITAHASKALFFFTSHESDRAAGILVEAGILPAILAQLAETERPAPSIVTIFQTIIGLMKAPDLRELVFDAVRDEIIYILMFNPDSAVKERALDIIHTAIGSATESAGKLIQLIDWGIMKILCDLLNFEFKDSKPLTAVLTVMLEFRDYSTEGGITAGESLLTHPYAVQSINDRAKQDVNFKAVADLLKKV